MNSRELFISRRLVCLCLLAAAAAATLVFLLAEVRMLQVRAQWDYGEGHVLWMSQQITNPERAYKPIDRLPYVVFPYPPLYLLASRAVAVIFGDLLIAGRSLSLACTIGIAVVIALTVFWCTSAASPRIWRLASAAFGAALMLCTESVVAWGGLMRVDMLALFLMFAGLAVYVALGQREQWQYLAVLLFVLALFTKQTMLCAPLACAIFGLVTNFRATIRVYGFAMILGLLALVVCNSVTHGGFLQNIVGYNLNSFSTRHALREVLMHLQASVSSTVVAFAALLSVWNGKIACRFRLNRFLLIRSARIYDRAILICGLNYLLAGIWTLSIGKVGSSSNFFLAWDISACFLCGLFLSRLLVTWSVNSRSHRTGSLALVLLCALMLLPARNAVNALTVRFDTNVEEEAKLIRLIRTIPGPVLSENLLVMTRAGKEIQIEPATVCFLIQAGRWDEGPYLRLLKQQYFQLIVARLRESSRYTPAMILAIEKSYALDQTIGLYSIYRPRPSL